MSQLLNQVIDIDRGERAVARSFPCQPPIRIRFQRLQSVESNLVAGQQGISANRLAQHSQCVDDHTQPMVVAAGALLPVVFERMVADPGSEEELWVEAPDVHRFDQRRLHPSTHGRCMSFAVNDVVAIRCLLLVDSVGQAHMMADGEGAGPPEQILTDNAKVLTARFRPGTGRVVFDRICINSAIRQILTKQSRRPHGTIERGHKSLRAEFHTRKVHAPGQVRNWLR